MEGLVLLLGEVLLAPLAAMVSMAAAVLVAVAGFAVSLLTGGRKSEPAKPDLTEGQPPKRRRGFAARLAAAAATLTALGVLALIIVDSLFFEPAVRWLANGVTARSNAEIRYASVDGSLLRGRLEFSGFRTERRGHPRRDFAFEAEHALVDLDVWSLLPFRTPTFERVAVRGVSGEIIEHPRDESERKRQPDFEIADLQLLDLSVTIRKGAYGSLILQAEQLEGHPFRSRFAIFDALFRSSVTGTVNGRRVRIITEQQGERRRTVWDMDALPVSAAAAFSDCPPFTWFADGMIDIDVRDEWQVRGRVDIRMDWRFRFRGVRVEVPDGGAGLTERALALATKKFFEAKGNEADVSFRLNLDQDQFEAAASGDATRLAEVVADAYADALVRLGYMSGDAVKERAREARDRLRGYLDRRRTQPSSGNGR